MKKEKNKTAVKLVSMRKIVKKKCKSCGIEFEAIKIAKYCAKCGSNANRCAAYRKRKERKDDKD